MSEGSKHVCSINCCISSLAWNFSSSVIRWDGFTFGLVCWAFEVLGRFDASRGGVGFLFFFVESWQSSSFCREFLICSWRQNNPLFRSCCFDLQLGPQPGSGFWIFETWPQRSNSYIVFEVFEISICSWGQKYRCVLKFWGFDLKLRSQ